MRIQIEGFAGYNEDQIALIIPDLSIFAVILGIPNFGCVVNVIKVKEIDALAMPWVNALIASFLAVWQVTDVFHKDNNSTKIGDCTGYDEANTNRESERIDTYPYKIIQVQMKTAYTGAKLDVMTHVLSAKDGPLPTGLAVKSAYTEMHSRSKNVAVVVSNRRRFQ